MVYVFCKPFSTLTFLNVHTYFQIFELTSPTILMFEITKFESILNFSFFLSNFFFGLIIISEFYFALTANCTRKYCSILRIRKSKWIYKNWRIIWIFTTSLSRESAVKCRYGDDKRAARRRNITYICQKIIKNGVTQKENFIFSCTTSVRKK